MLEMVVGDIFDQCCDVLSRYFFVFDGELLKLLLTLRNFRQHYQFHCSLVDDGDDDDDLKALQYCLLMLMLMLLIEVSDYYCCYLPHDKRHSFQSHKHCEALRLFVLAHFGLQTVLSDSFVLRTRMWFGFVFVVVAAAAMEELKRYLSLAFFGRVFFSF